MPSLPNAKHERFAQGIADGKPVYEAYRQAGYKAHRGNSSALRAKQHISERVAELLKQKGDALFQPTAKAIEKLELTKTWVLTRLIENANRAMQASEMEGPEGERLGSFVYQGSVANRALELLGKELGMFIDRKEVGQPGDFDDMAADELRRSIATDLEKLGEENPPLAALNGAGKANGSGRTH